VPTGCCEKPVQIVCGEYTYCTVQLNVLYKLLIVYITTAHDSHNIESS